jgi:hypothetical protein
MTLAEGGKSALDPYYYFYYQYRRNWLSRSSSSRGISDEGGKSALIGGNSALAISG